jgi:hypothetical protein
MMNSAMKSPTIKEEGRVLLRDQLDQQDKLIEILKDRIVALEEVLSPILLQEPTNTERDSEPAVGSQLAPLQTQMMLQYNRLNMLVSSLENIHRRVQL